MGFAYLEKKVLALSWTLYCEWHNVKSQHSNSHTISWNFLSKDVKTTTVPSEVPSETFKSF